MKITANIATYPPRKESLKRMLESIAGQFDEVRVCFNEYKNQDEIYNFGHWFTDTYATSFVICWPVENLTDNGKFYGLDRITEPEYYFTLDDDLIYPPDYVEKTLEALKVYGCIVSHHGRRLLGTGLNYYKGHKAFRCLDEIKEAERIDVPGTGVMAFDTRYFHPKGLAHDPRQRMSDLIFAEAAAKAGKQIGVLPHPLGWIKHINNKETIYETETRNGIQVQNGIADEIYKMNYGSDL